ncbi:MAG: hypothetical protein H6745_30450 [Deltaproteobacteria bacterium]|nr:hypothetical protein [Deltaproteobacteria bacterium]
MNVIHPFIGHFEGQGTWYDAAGKSQAYRVSQTLSASDDGFELAFRHDFDDGDHTDAMMQMRWIAPHLFALEMNAVPVGHGYVFGDTLHYHLLVGGKVVEAAYRDVGEGELVVLGSSSSNTEGNFIAWRETLEHKKGHS